MYEGAPGRFVWNTFGKALSIIFFPLGWFWLKAPFGVVASGLPLMVVLWTFFLAWVLIASLPAFYHGIKLRQVWMRMYDEELAKYRYEQEHLVEAEDQNGPGIHHPSHSERYP